MGFPIGDLVLATNANRVIPEYLATGDWQPRASVHTLASAMDVGNPSNMERLRYLLPDFAAQRQSIEAYPVEDESIREFFEVIGPRAPLSERYRAELAKALYR